MTIRAHISSRSSDQSLLSLLVFKILKQEPSTREVSEVARDLAEFSAYSQLSLEQLYSLVTSG
jgi:hypothetical protein